MTTFSVSKGSLLFLEVGFLLVILSGECYGMDTENGESWQAGNRSGIYYNWTSQSNFTSNVERNPLAQVGLRLDKMMLAQKQDFRLNNELIDWGQNSNSDLYLEGQGNEENIAPANWTRSGREGVDQSLIKRGPSQEKDSVYDKMTKVTAELCDVVAFEEELLKNRGRGTEAAVMEMESTGTGVNLDGLWSKVQLEMDCLGGEEYAPRSGQENINIGQRRASGNQSELDFDELEKSTSDVTSLLDEVGPEIETFSNAKEDVYSNVMITWGAKIEEFEQICHEFRGHMATGCWDGTSVLAYLKPLSKAYSCAIQYASCEEKELYENILKESVSSFQNDQNIFHLLAQKMAKTQTFCLFSDIAVYLSNMNAPGINKADGEGQTFMSILIGAGRFSTAGWYIENMRANMYPLALDDFFKFISNNSRICRTRGEAFKTFLLAVKNKWKINNERKVTRNDIEISMQKNCTGEGGKRRGPALLRIIGDIFGSGDSREGVEAANNETNLPSQPQPKKRKFNNDGSGFAQRGDNGQLGQGRINNNWGYAELPGGLDGNGARCQRQKFIDLTRD